MANAAAAEKDPWLDGDQQFGTVDFTRRPGDEDLVEELHEEHAAQVEASAPVETVATEEVPPAAPAPPTDAPTVIEANGAKVTIEKTKKGWKGTAEVEGLTPEIFYGATKDELYQSIAISKAHATGKIRELMRKQKLGIGQLDTLAPQPIAVPSPSNRELTADDLFEIKTTLATDPGKAFDLYFQRRFGLTAEQLVGLVSRGASAAQELDAESVSRAFLAAAPGFYACPSNYESLVAWMSRSYLRRNLAPGATDATMTELANAGYWTVANLTRAYNELSQDGLLETAPREPEVTEAAPPAIPAVPSQPAPTEQRIAGNVVRRPRAGLGLRATTETIAAPPRVTERPPSAEGFDDLSDEEVNALLAGVRREKIRSLR